MILIIIQILKKKKKKPISMVKDWYKFGIDFEWAGFNLNAIILNEEEWIQVELMMEDEDG